MNIQQNKGIDENNNNLNLNILSSIKSIPSRNISLSFTGNRDKEIPSEINLINTTNIAKDISHSILYSNTMPNNSGSILNKTIENIQFQNNIEQKPFFEQCITPNYYTFNYFFNISSLYPYILNQQNYYPFNYNINNYNYNYSDLNQNYSPNNNLFNQFHDLNNENIFLNKKRFCDDNLYNSNIEQNNLLYKKDSNIIKKKNEKDNNKKEEKKKKYTCKLNGCHSIFRTKKLAFYHHLKMSSECQDDCISLLKLIYETKKIILKNIPENSNSFNKYSSLYENSLKNLSFYGYIKMYTGIKINDNL